MSGSAPIVAALYVDRHGVYSRAPGVDVWDVTRDARLYDGPHPVVAHPPCDRWSIMGLCRGYYDGDDGGCFESALAAVRTYGGVLEHPEHSLAWKRYDLPAPRTYGWTRSLFDPGWSCLVDQSRYGLPVRKPTWLYFAGDTPPPAILWGRACKGTRSVHDFHWWNNAQRSVTVPAFRDTLLMLARSARARAPAIA